MAPPAKKKQPAAKKAVSTSSAGKKKARASSPDEGPGTASAAAAPTGTPAQKTATELGIRDRRLANVVAGALGGGGGPQSREAAEGLAGLSVVERVAGAVDGAAAVAADDDAAATTATGKKGRARLLIGGVDVLGRLNARGIAGRVFNDGLSASLGSQSRIFAGPAASAFTDGNARLQRARELKYPSEQAGAEVAEIAAAAAPGAATPRHPSKFDNLSSELAAQLGLRGTVVPAALAAPPQRAPLVTFAAACQGTAATVMAGAASDAVAHRARSHFSTCEGGLPIRGAPASLCTVCQGVARYTCTRCLGLHGYFCSADCLATHRAARCLKHVV